MLSRFQPNPVVTSEVGPVVKVMLPSNLARLKYLRWASGAPRRQMPEPAPAMNAILRVFIIEETIRVPP